MAILPGLGFGSGQLLASPQTTSGNPAVDPTPLQVGVLQNIKCTLGGDIKTLFGQNQWPVDSAVGKRTIKGSFEFAQISNIFLNQLFLADTVAAGVVTPVLNELHTAAATITVTQAAHFVADNGVTYQATGVPLINIGSGTPAAGQYTVVVATGVYTLATADVGLAMFFTYTWTQATVGTTLTASNHPMGWGPVLQLNAFFPYDGGIMGFYFPNVRLGKIDLTSKLDDYTMITTDWEAFAGAANIPFISYAAF
jgi:hypothetical protein